MMAVLWCTRGHEPLSWDRDKDGEACWYCGAQGTITLKGTLTPASTQPVRTQRARTQRAD